MLVRNSCWLSHVGAHKTILFTGSTLEEDDDVRRVSPRKTQGESKAEKETKKPTIKKPLNAFMLYMKEMRAKVIAECTLKESAAINQILGRRVRLREGGLAGMAPLCRGSV